MSPSQRDAPRFYLPNSNPCVIPRRFDGNITLAPEELSNLRRLFMHLAVENVIMLAIDGGIRND